MGGTGAPLSTLAARFRELALAAFTEAGFPAVGIVDIDRVDLSRDVAHYDTWLSEGRAGAMEYLVRGRDRRANPRLLLPEAQSVLSVAWTYDSRPAGAMDPAQGPRYARYLRAGDYHDEARGGMSRAAEKLAQAWLAEAGRTLKWKSCVDTSAVLERFWAAANGLGWIGKNAMLIHPKLGSYLFLGEVLFSEASGAGPQFLPDYCGHCTRCLEGCPTGALIAPRKLDAPTCTAYFTLEKRGDFGVPEAVTEKSGTWVAGCDVCQEVCPFNQKAAKSGDLREDSPINGALAITDWKSLLSESGESYRARTRNSALDRVKPADFSRNLALALRNAKLSHDHVQALSECVSQRLEKEPVGESHSQWEQTLKSLSASLGQFSRRSSAHAQRYPSESEG